MKLVPHFVQSTSKYHQIIGKHESLIANSLKKIAPSLGAVDYEIIGAINANCFY